MFAFKNVLYFQAGLGGLANMFLLCFYIFILIGNRLKPTDLISCQLTFIHMMIFLTGGDLLITDIFASLNIDNDFICKATFYISRVTRGLSICTTCLLSVFQAVTISPSTSMLAKFKQKLKKYMIYVFLCIWSFNLSYSSNWFFYVRGFTNVSETNQMQVTEFWHTFPHELYHQGIDVNSVNLQRCVSCRSHADHKYIHGDYFVQTSEAMQASS
ncbi:mCG140235 [Mus musculus]|nr:mCG140235 [Mus musculus]